MTITVGTKTDFTAAANASSPQSQSVAVGANVEMLVVVVSIFDTSSTDGVVSGVTFNTSENFTEGFTVYNTTADFHLAVWYLLDPTNTTANVSVSFGGTVTDFMASVIEVHGTVGTFEVDSTATHAIGNGNPSITWSTNNANTILFASAGDDQPVGTNVTLDTGPTSMFIEDVGTDTLMGAYRIVSSAGSQTISWTDSDADEDYQVMAIAFREVAGATSLTVQDGDHVHTADTPGLTQHNILVAQDGDHIHDTDPPALTQHNVLVVQDGDHLHDGENVGLVPNLIVNDGDHTHVADNVTLVPNLIVNDGDHVLVSDEVTLSVPATTLTVQDGDHVHDTDGIALTQHNVLVVNDGAHIHAADNVTLEGLNSLVIQDAAHVLTSDEVGLTQHNVLVVQDSVHFFEQVTVGIIRKSHVGVAPPEHRNKETRKPQTERTSAPQPRIREKVIVPLGKRNRGVEEVARETQKFREEQEEREELGQHEISRGMELFIDEAERFRAIQASRQLRDDTIERDFKKTGEILQGDELSRKMTGEKLRQAKVARKSEREAKRKAQLKEKRKNLRKARRALAKKRKNG